MGSSCADRLELILRQDNVIIIIYTCSYKSPVDIELESAIGANEYIIKPKEPSVFTQLIEKLSWNIKNRATTYHPPYDQPKPTA